MNQAAAAAKQILIAVIGGSDVMEDGQPFQRPYEGGQQRLRRVTNGQSDEEKRKQLAEIRLPLLEPLLTSLPAVERRLDQIVLIGTEQQPCQPDDTRPCRDLVVAKLVGEHGYDHAIFLSKNYTENPADYERTFSYMQQLFAGLLRDFPAGSTTCHLALTGGTPQLTTALLIEGFNAYGAQARMHYQSKTVQKPQTLAIVQNLQAQALRQALRTHIEHYAYGAAERLVSEQQEAFRTLCPTDDQRQLIKGLLQHGARRLHANLTGARQRLKAQYQDRMSAAQWNALSLQDHPAGSRQADAQTIREIIAAADVMYKRGHYFDFITRVGTFRDLYARYVACHKHGAKLSPSTGDKLTFEAWLDEPAQTELKRWLQNGHHDITKPPMHGLFRAVSQFYCGRNRNERDRCYPGFRDDGPLEELADLRHSTVHGYEDITHNLIQDTWNATRVTVVGATSGEKIVAHLWELASRIGVPDGDRDPYKTLNEVLLQQLRP